MGDSAMLTFQDCIDVAGMSEGEVDAIARHEHIPAMVALELGDHLLQSPGGTMTIRQFLVDDILEAQARHSCRDCIKLSKVLRSFLETCRDTDMTGEYLSGLAAIGLVGQVRAISGRAPPIAVRTIFNEIDEARQRGDCSMCANQSRRLVALPGVAKPALFKALEP